MGHCSDQKASGSARTIQHPFIHLGINHFDHHFHDVTGGEEFPTVTTQISPHDFLVGFTLDVDVRIKQAVSLQLAYNICQTTWGQFNLIIRIKNLTVPFFYTFKNLRNTLLYCQLTIRIGAFFRCSVKL